jgi:anti-sigma regulatory factor (Ser/Thr protein kinase)
MARDLDLALAADPSEAKRLRYELHAWLLQHGINGLTGHDITLAAVEGFANAVQHPVKRRTHTVRLHGQIETDGVAVTIQDDGTWHERSRNREHGGYGLKLIESLMNSVQVERSQTGTRISMRRDL